MNAKIIWFTGLSGAGKSTIADVLKTELEKCGKTVSVLDGDSVRDKLHKHLGFTREDIMENNRLIAELAKKSAEEADVVLVPIISPFAESRALAKKIIGDGFVELYIESSEATRVARDPKGLYRKVKEGNITNMIGHGGVPYEVPTYPDLTLNTDDESLAQSVARLLRFLGALEK